MSTDAGRAMAGGSEIDLGTLDLLPYGIIVVDEDGVVLYYNSREEQISGRDRTNVVGRNFFTEIAPCTQVREFQGRFKETMLERESPVTVFRFTFPFPGRPREVEISLTRFMNRGAPLCLISVNDITEQSSLRDRILLSERLREVGEVAAGVAHNFNNLLTVILGNAGLLLAREDLDTESRESLEAIRRASQDGVAVVRRIAEMSRPSHALEELPTVSVDDLVAESVAFVKPYAEEAQRQRGARFDWAIEPAGGSPEVRGVDSELREVLINLLRNAVDAMPDGGTIAVRSRRVGDDVTVDVVDTGSGMTMEVKEKLFRPLFTTKGERGTGLGLATCHGLIRRHRGEIVVKSAPGQGTTMTVRLPAG